MVHGDKGTPEMHDARLYWISHIYALPHSPATSLTMNSVTTLMVSHMLGLTSPTTTRITPRAGNVHIKRSPNRRSVDPWFTNVRLVRNNPKRNRMGPCGVEWCETSSVWRQSSWLDRHNAALCCTVTYKDGKKMAVNTPN